MSEIRANKSDATGQTSRGKAVSGPRNGFAAVRGLDPHALNCVTFADTIPARVLDRALLRILGGLEAPKVDYEIERLVRMGAHGEDDVERAIRRLGGESSYLYKRLRSSAAPPPQALIGWGALIRAMQEWDPTPNGGRGAGLSLERAAHSLGYCSGSGLSSSFKRYTGIGCRTWLQRGADMDDLVDLLLAHWRAREPNRRKRKAAVA